MLNKDLHRQYFIKYSCKIWADSSRFNGKYNLQVTRGLTIRDSKSYQISRINIYVKAGLSDIMNESYHDALSLWLFVTDARNVLFTLPSEVHWTGEYYEEYYDFTKILSFKLFVQLYVLIS